LLEVELEIIPKLKCLETSKNYGRFLIEPLERGYGITLGNALRRVLLSSLPGAAVTAVRIAGIQHEFSTLPHMKEDIIEFLLNIKGICLRPLTGRAGSLFLEVEGERKVYAGDIKPSADFEIVNPELYLATLDSPEAKLEVEFFAEAGKGYVPASTVGGRPIGVLPVDAIFTPIRRVNYQVEKTRVGDRSDFDKLTLEIWTNGAISPEDALGQGAQILIRHLSLFSKLRPEMLEEELKPELPEEEAAKAVREEVPLEKLGLSSRVLNALRRGGIRTVDELLKKSKEELLSLSNFGEKAWQELQERLEALGLAAKPEEAAPEEGGLEEARRKLLERGFKVTGEK